MLLIIRIILFLALLALPKGASEYTMHAEKKPVGLRKSAPDGNDLTFQDRKLWKSVLKWCDECDERAKRYMTRWGRFDESYGGIHTYQLSANQYIVDVQCSMSMQQSEHIYFKVTEQADKIETRLLPLEQFYFIVDPNAADNGDIDPTKERIQKGEFIRFTDPLIYGLTQVDHKKKQLIVEKRYRGMGGCGLLTIYDVSGDYPKVVEFRGKTYCSANYVPPRKWKLYPAKQRARWRIAPNPLREDWKNPNQCR